LAKKEMGENPPNNFSTKFYWIYPKGLKKIEMFPQISIMDQDPKSNNKY